VFAFRKHFYDQLVCVHFVLLINRQAKFCQLWFKCIAFTAEEQEIAVHFSAGDAKYGTLVVDSQLVKLHQIYSRSGAVTHLKTRAIFSGGY